MKIKGWITGSQESVSKHNKRKSLKPMSSEPVEPVSSTGRLFYYFNRVCFGLSGLNTCGRQGNGLSSGRSTTAAPAVIASSGSGSAKGGQMRSRKSAKTPQPLPSAKGRCASPSAPSAPARAIRDAPPSGPAKLRKPATTSSSEPVREAERKERVASTGEDDGRGQVSLVQEVGALSQADEAGALKERQQKVFSSPVVDDEAGVALQVAQHFPVKTEGEENAAPANEASSPDSEGKKARRESKKKQRGSAVLSLVAQGAEETEADATDGEPGSQEQNALVVSDAEMSETLVSESEALILSRFNLAVTSRATPPCSSPSPSGAATSSPSPAREEPGVLSRLEVQGAASDCFTRRRAEQGAASDERVSTPDAALVECSEEDTSNKAAPALSSSLSTSSDSDKSPERTSASQEERRCHCNKPGCEFCSVYAARESVKDRDIKADKNAAKAGLQVSVVHTGGVPQFRKRKPRKDLDLSACDPVGYFNGNNGNSNLCFMNAGLQLLLHAMHGLPDDLNRCKEPVALALREWVEAVLECGRTYTPGSTPKFAKMPPSTSPKFTVIGCNASASSQPPSFKSGVAKVKGVNM